MSTDRISERLGTSALNGSVSPTKTGAAAGETGAQDFGATLRLQVATLKAQSLSTLVSSVSDAGNNTILTTLAALNGQSVGESSAIPGVSATGRVNSLHDPELAYRMMSVINQAEATYTAQRNELTEMRSMLNSLSQAAADLGQPAVATDSASLASRMDDFRNTYNAWIDRFAEDFLPGGALHGNQAAQVTRSELRNIIGDIFTGAAHGFQGLGDLGLSIDAGSQHANFDGKPLADALGQNASGVQATLPQFAAHFTQATTLLASAGNFIDNRLNNLQRALDFIAENKPALQAEFGLGDPAKPVLAGTSTTAALASYRKAADV